MSVEGMIYSVFWLKGAINISNGIEGFSQESNNQELLKI